MNYMKYVTPESPYCIQDGIPMVLFTKGNERHFLCGHCGICTECGPNKGSTNGI